MTKTLRYEEADHIASGEFLWSGFAKCWHRKLNLTNDFAILK